VNLKSIAIAAVLAGPIIGLAAPAPRGDGPAPDPDVSAPVAYKDLMLVLVTKDGAAAVTFGGASANGNEVEYIFRYESADGKKKLSGTGKLFERRLGAAGGYDPEGLYIVAGPMKLLWSKGGEERGWIYYALEVMSVHLAHGDNFKRRVHKFGQLESAVEELNLRRYMKK